MRYTKIGRELKEFSLEIVRIGTMTAIFSGPVVGLAYLATNPETEREYRLNQQRAAKIADEKCGNECNSNKRLYEFVKAGGILAIR